MEKPNELRIILDFNGLTERSSKLNVVFERWIAVITGTLDQKRNEWVIKWKWHEKDFVN